MESIAKLRFRGFNGVDGLRPHFAGHDTGHWTDGIITGADKNEVLQLPITSVE
ncbi:MAG: hypothetical protein LBB40_02120 [Holophagales bacterium]|nr:hypothetical protein [Holophagales bacterium]